MRMICIKQRWSPVGRFATTGSGVFADVHTSTSPHHGHLQLQSLGCNTSVNRNFFLHSVTRVDHQTRHIAVATNVIHVNNDHAVYHFHLHDLPHLDSRTICKLQSVQRLNFAKRGAICVKVAGSTLIDVDSIFLKVFIQEPRFCAAGFVMPPNQFTSIQ
jgi:hypothetical protein